MEQVELGKVELGKEQSELRKEHDESVEKQDDG